MPPVLKHRSLHLLFLSLVFFLFFQASKHHPALSHNNPFADDPYDAVGSFAIQYAFFIAGLSLLRSFRHYPSPASDAQQQLIATGQLTGLAAIAITLVADLIAMLRHPAIFAAGSPGLPLLASIVVLLLATAWSATPLFRLLAAARSSRPSSRHLSLSPLLLPLIAVTAAIGVLLLYPEHIRQNLVGALATVIVGALCLFLPLRSFAGALAPPVSAHASDLSDDLLAVLAAVRNGRRERTVHPFLPPARVAIILKHLLGQRARWVVTALLGGLLGAALALAELRDDGFAPDGKRPLVLAAYIGLELSAVLIGFALLERPLRLSTRDQAPTPVAFTA